VVVEFDGPKAETGYDNELSPERQKELVKELIKERPPQKNGRYAYYEVACTSDAANIARTIEAAAFKEYFDEAPSEVREMYAPYERQSMFFLAVDLKTTTPVGALRAQRNGAAGLLTLNDVAAPITDKKGVGGIPIDVVKDYHGIENLDDCWDIGAVAVLPDYRGDKRTSVMLYRAMYKKAMEQRVEHIVSIIDKKPYEGSMLALGIPFKPLAGIAEPFRYYGSKLSHAAYGHIPDFFPIMDKYRRTGKGRVIDFVVHGALSRLIKGSRDKEINLLAA
jgi:hypothetical protein